MPKMPLARPRCSSGNAPKMSERDSGKSAAPLAPCRTRKRMRILIFQARPHKTEPRVNNARESRYMRLMPKRLARKHEAALSQGIGGGDVGGHMQVRAEGPLNLRQSGVDNGDIQDTDEGAKDGRH